MSENTPFTNCESFTNLFNETSVPQTPLFTSQVNTPVSFQNIDGAGVEENSPEAAREARRRWSALEDGVLVSGWLNTSKDAIVGNEQKAGAFWKRVAAYFAASPAVKDLQKREWNNCKQRWGKINESVLKFCGCYDQAQRQSSSGQSEDDIFQMAYKLYFQDQRANFTLEHCWRMLRHDQKWCSLVSQKRKRARLDESGANSSPSNKDCPMEDQTMERPMGVKAAKAKGKKSGMPTTEERDANVKRLESVWEIRKEDLAVKERLSKQKLLDSLLGKPEPLSEIDIYLKNKLISEMYP